MASYDPKGWIKYLPPLDENGNPPPRPPRYEKSGLLLVDKPADLSSMDVLRVIKKIGNIKKAGHGGTLDPFATGLLPVLVNQATRLSTAFLKGDKQYEGTMLFGQEYDTQDITGKPIGSPVSVSEDLTIERLNELAGGYEGTIRQVPPVYSAIKKEGRPLYDYARKGEIVTPEAREVFVRRFEITEEKGSGEFGFFVDCGKGVYVRTLIHDLAKSAGSVAAVSTLRRLRVGAFEISMAVKLEEITSQEVIDQALIEPEEAAGALDIRLG